MSHQGPGIRGMGVARGVVFLFVLTLVLAMANLLWTAHEVNTVKTRFADAAAAEQARGVIVEHKICLTLHRLAALQPPAGNPAVNPSRKFAQDLHRTLSELGPDLGCPP